MSFDLPVWWPLLSEDDRLAALEDFEERAAVMEFVGGLERREAERAAAELIRERWAGAATISRSP